MTAQVASLPVVRALLDEARKRNDTDGGVLGLRARPEWGGPDEFEHAGLPVAVVPCTSALAVREALLRRGHGRWLVVLTDRDERDLGVGIMAHLAWQRLRQPDPWDAVRDRFAATRIDHRLVVTEAAREIATGLLVTMPTTGWPPARGGLLTPDHALGAVAHAQLDVATAGEDVDERAVLRWSVGLGTSTAVTELRSLGGEALTRAVLSWLAERCGALAPVVGRLSSADRVADLVPLGLAARSVVASSTQSGPRALLRREIGTGLVDEALLGWAVTAEDLTRELLRGEPEAAARVLARGDALVIELEAAEWSTASDVLLTSLVSRLAALGEALRAAATPAAARAAGSSPDVPLIGRAELARVEDAAATVERHALAAMTDEVRTRRAGDGVRLARWLARPSAPPTADLLGLIARQQDEDSWVDRAVSEAWAGVGDEGLAQGLRAVLDAVRLRRTHHDLAFARALAVTGGAPPPGVLGLESVVSELVVPLVRSNPVLMVVADGMSAAIASEVVDDVVQRYDSWLECLPDRRSRRLSALSVLPSLTSVSRTSLLCGELRTGEQNAERRGFAHLVASHGLSGQVFHKLELDTSHGGYELADAVARAIDDTSGVRLVACVLNTIDDALDRSDPGGTDWTAATVKHLRPLLDRARRAGRIVVLTSDHGHVIERRQGRQRTAADASSNRSRSARGGEADPGEVRVRGPRVVLHDGDAVLAVDEQLRYGPLKAGYHGGAAPAEVVVPVIVLTSGEPPRGWQLAAPQAPDWWRGPVAAVEPATHAATARGQSSQPPTLFDDRQPTDLADEVVASTTYSQQRTRAARSPILDEQVVRLLRALLLAPSHRLDPESAAAALGVAVVQLPGALGLVQRLLNVEQYAVLGRDPDGSTVVLDVALLREQFSVG